jgi:hypothetical protein
MSHEIETVVIATPIAGQEVISVRYWVVDS